MAPVLVCPECSTKHPLDSIGPRSVFPCEGCGRTLKVPVQAIVSTSAASSPAARTPATPAPSGDPNATHVFSPQEPVADGEALTTPDPSPASPLRDLAPIDEWRDPVPPRWARFALWVVAIPLAFIVVFALARRVGFAGGVGFDEPARKPDAKPATSRSA